MLLLNYLSSFILGLLTPLSAVCVLPLYPGYISYMTLQLGKNKLNPFRLGLMVNLGLISFMLILGIIFTAILKVSLSQVILVISPVAFIMLAIISLLLIFDKDFSKYFPKLTMPGSKNPLFSSFLFGFFFGAIIIPCNPGFIAAFFTKTAATSYISFFAHILNFFFFAIGIGFPLLLLSLLPLENSRRTLNFLTTNKKFINRIAGIIMLWISIYYLSCVFGLFSLGPIYLVCTITKTLFDSLNRIVF